MSNVKNLCNLPILAMMTVAIAGTCVSTTAFAATVPGVLPSFITAGLPDPDGKVPAINGVPGSGVSNLDVAFPATILNHGTAYVYTISFQDYNVTADYEVEYELTQTVDGTKTTLDSGTIVSGKSFTPGTAWVWDIEGKAIPDKPGLAVLEGKIKYGTGYATEVKISTTVVIE